LLTSECHRLLGHRFKAREGVSESKTERGRRRRIDGRRGEREIGPHPLADGNVWRQHFVDDSLNVGIWEHCLHTNIHAAISETHGHRQVQQPGAGGAWHVRGKADKKYSPAYLVFGQGVFVWQKFPPGSLAMGRQSPCSLFWGRSRPSAAALPYPTASPAPSSPLSRLSCSGMSSLTRRSILEFRRSDPLTPSCYP